MADAGDVARQNSKLGGFVQPGLAAAYPDLYDLSMSYVAKVQELPWVPSTYTGDVTREVAQSTDGPGGIWGFRRATSTITGLVLDNIPAWLDTPAKQAAWDAIAGQYAKALNAFAQNKVEEGRTIIAQAVQNASFWTAMYDAAKFIRDVPKNILDAAGSVASDAALTALKAFFPFLVIVGIGIFAYIYTRNKLRS